MDLWTSDHGSLTKSYGIFSDNDDIDTSIEFRLILVKKAFIKI